MSLRNVGIVYRKELSEALRDRRTIVSSILIPLFLFPLLTFGIGFAFVAMAGEATREPSKIMILGGEDSPGVVQQLRASRNLREVPRSADSWISFPTKRFAPRSTSLRVSRPPWSAESALR